MRGQPPALGPDGGFTESAWHQFKLDAIALLNHAEALAAAGWDTLSLFGLHPVKPAVRVSHMGLAACLKGAELIEITPAAIRLRHHTGSLLRFYRVPSQPGALPAWRFHHDPHDQQETDMPYEESTAFDPEAYVADTLAFLAYSVEGVNTYDLNVPPGSFLLRSGRNRVPVDLTGGTIFDWVTSAIGWMRTSGVAGEAPHRVWSQTRAKQIPRPSPDHKTAFWAQGSVLIDGALTRWIWETSQAASWKAYRELMLMVAVEGPKHLPKLPLVVHTGRTPVMVPTFKILSYEDRPACLPTDPDKHDRTRNQGNQGSDPELNDDIPF
jgi:hypothetical protein